MKASIALLLLVVTGPGLLGQTLLHHYEFNSSQLVDSVGNVNGTLINGASISNGRIHLDGVNDYAEMSSYIIPSSGGYNAEWSIAFFAQQLSI